MKNMQCKDIQPEDIVIQNKIMLRFALYEDTKGKFESTPTRKSTDDRGKTSIPESLNGSYVTMEERQAHYKIILPTTTTPFPWTVIRQLK